MGQHTALRRSRLGQKGEHGKQGIGFRRNEGDTVRQDARLSMQHWLAPGYC